MFDDEKDFLFTIFHYHLIPHVQMVIHWNEFCEENENCEGRICIVIKFVKRYTYQITLIFHGKSSLLVIFLQ